MLEDRALELHQGSIDDLTVLWPTFGLIALGDADPGVNWHCPACGELLAQAVYPSQFLDVLFECFSCGELCASLRRQPGQPLTSRLFPLPPGKYRLDKTLNVTGKAPMVIGRQALDGYIAETSVGSASSVAETFVPREINASFLRELVRKAANLLGDRYERLRASDQRGQSSPTPPVRRHRLIELICYAEEASRALDIPARPGEQRKLDADKFNELNGLVIMFELWKNHPAWPKLVSGLASETECQHSFIILAVAWYLLDAGNGVGLMFKDALGRIPDLWIEPNLVERVYIEVKTPIALRGRRPSPLSVKEAEDIISRSVKKAASRRRGQLDPEYSGLLAFGTFHLTSDEVATLISAANHILERQQSRKSHLAGIIVSSFSYTTNTTTDALGIPRIEFTPTLQTRVVRHPGYEGDITIKEDSQVRRTRLPS